MRTIDADALAENMCDCACADCDHERTISTKCSEIRWTYLKILNEQPTIEEQSAQTARKRGKKMVTLGNLIERMESDELITIMNGATPEIKGMANSELWKPHYEREVRKIKAYREELRIWLEEEGNETDRC